MNPDELFYLVGAPTARPRTIADLAADAEALALELTSAAAVDGELAIPVDEAQGKLLAAAKLLRDAFDDAHALKLAELEQLCAHCGHAQGEHRVEAPHACENEEDGEHFNLWDCKCPGYQAPGVYAVDPERDTERPPAPATEPA